MLYMFLAVPPPIIRSTRTTHSSWHIPDAVCTVLVLLMMGGKTARNMYSILLVVLKRI